MFFAQIPILSSTEKKDTKIRLCLQHEGSQGQSRGSSTFQTPTRAARRELGTQMSLCSPRGQRAAVDALDIPSLVDNLGGGSIPAVIHTPSSTSVARVLDASGTTGNIVPGVRTGGSLGPSVAGSMFLGSAGFPLSVPYSYAIPMSNMSGGYERRAGGGGKKKPDSWGVNIT
jgi:hypothetical protein